MTESRASPAPQACRLWLAFAALPFADALLAFLAFPLVWHIGGNTGPVYDPGQSARVVALLAGFLGLVVTLFGAVPVVISLRQRGPVSLRQLLVAGLILGNAPFLLYVIGLILPATLVHLLMGTMSEHLVPAASLIAPTLRVLAAGSVMGAWSALVFWFLGMRAQRPYQA